MVGELECAKRMGHAFNCIGLAMREVIGRIDTPTVAGARMFGVQNPVDHRVAEVHVARSDVDFGA